MNKENTNEEECNCKEMSCQKGCARNHTHKGFFCEICEPEACKKMREPAKVIPPEEKLSMINIGRRTGKSLSEFEALKNIPEEKLSQKEV